MPGGKRGPVGHSECQQDGYADGMAMSSWAVAGHFLSSGAACQQQAV